MADEIPRRMNWAETRARRFGRKIRYKFVEKYWHKWGMKQEPQIGMEGGSEAEIRTELNPEYTLNLNLIDTLKRLEQLNWIGLEKKIWMEIVPLYKALSFLTDPL